MFLLIIKYSFFAKANFFNYLNKKTRIYLNIMNTSNENQNKESDETRKLHDINQEQNSRQQASNPFPYIPEAKKPVAEKEAIFKIFKIKKINNWTEEEDNRLKELVENADGNNWKKLAEFFPGKSAIQCSARYKRIRPGLFKGYWTTEEDNKLMHCWAKHGRNWKYIAEEMPHRSGKQIRDRFLNSLNPELNKKKFSAKEDKKLISLYNEYGPAWSKISKTFIGRSSDMIKNRFFSFIRKKIIPISTTMKFKKRILINELKNETKKKTKNLENNFPEAAAKTNLNHLEGFSLNVLDNPYHNYTTPDYIESANHSSFYFNEIQKSKNFEKQKKNDCLKIENRNFAILENEKENTDFEKARVLDSQCIRAFEPAVAPYDCTAAIAAKNLSNAKAKCSEINRFAGKDFFLKNKNFQQNFFSENNQNISQAKLRLELNSDLNTAADKNKNLDRRREFKKNLRDFSNDFNKTESIIRKKENNSLTSNEIYNIELNEENISDEIKSNNNYNNRSNSIQSSNSSRSCNNNINNKNIKAVCEKNNLENDLKSERRLTKPNIRAVNKMLCTDNNEINNDNNNNIFCSNETSKKMNNRTDFANDCRFSSQNARDFFNKEKYFNKGAFEDEVFQKRISNNNELNNKGMVYNHDYHNLKNCQLSSFGDIYQTYQNGNFNIDYNNNENKKNRYNYTFNNNDDDNNNNNNYEINNHQKAFNEVTASPKKSQGLLLDLDYKGKDNIFPCFKDSRNFNTDNCNNHIKNSIETNREVRRRKLGVKYTFNNKHKYSSKNLYNNLNNRKASVEIEQNTNYNNHFSNNNEWNFLKKKENEKNENLQCTRNRFLNSSEFQAGLTNHADPTEFRFLNPQINSSNRTDNPKLDNNNALNHENNETSQKSKFKNKTKSKQFIRNPKAIELKKIKANSFNANNSSNFNNSNTNNNNNKNSFNSCFFNSNYNFSQKENKILPKNKDSSSKGRIVEDSALLVSSFFLADIQKVTQIEIAKEINLFQLSLKRQHETVYGYLTHFYNDFFYEIFLKSLVFSPVKN